MDSKFPADHPMRRFEPRFEFYRTESVNGVDVDWWKELATGMILHTADVETITRFIDGRIERTRLSREHLVTCVGQQVEDAYDCVRLEFPGSRSFEELTDQEREYLCCFYSEALRRIVR